MSKKLTGHEAVKAFKNGKKLTRGNEVIQLTHSVLLYGEVFSRTITNILAHDDWEIVPEPMIWEGEREVDEKFGSLVVHLPQFLWCGKRVKVRIEEIPE